MSGPSDRPLRIGVFTDSYRPYLSGVVRVIETTSRILAQAGHQVVIFAPGYRGTPKPDPWEEPGIRIVRLPSVPAPNYPGFALPLPWRAGLGRLVGELKLDVVHTHSPFLTGAMALRLARRLGLPIVFTHHTMYHEYVHYAPVAQGLARRWVWRHVAQYCAQVDAVVAVSHRVQQLVQDEYRVKTPVELIPSGVDLRLYQDPQRDPTWLRRTYQIPPTNPVLVNVGRLTLEKNPLLLLDALHLLRQDSGLGSVDPWLVLVGDGPQADWVRQQAQRRGLADRVVLTGRLDPTRVADALLGADVFVMASFTETQGLVVAEALACGLPCVVVDSPPLREAVSHGEAGLIVAGEPDALASACRQLLLDAALRQRLQQAACRRAAQLSVEAATAHLVHLYEHLRRG